VVPAADPQRLADAIAHMAGDPTAAAEMGRQGRLTVEQRYSLPSMLAAYESLYERLLPGRLKE
jgi:glycosyltransferase involved in cell wall biosynthesis